MPQDASRKLLFSHPRMVEDLLTGFVARPWSDALDFATLENRPAAFVSDGLRQRYGDLLWRLRCGETWLYVPLEFQSTVDRSMAARLLTYTGLLYQDLFRRGALGPDGKLPPVLPVVFYNGRRSRWTAPLGVTGTVSSVVGALARYQPSLRYFLLDVGRYGVDDLPRGNLVSALILLENSRSLAELERGLDRLAVWVRGPGERELKRAFGGWIRQVLLRGRFPETALERAAELEEERTMLEEQVEEWTRQWFEDGREEGRKQGRAEERALFLRHLTARKFGVDAELEKERTMLEEQVEEWTRQWFEDGRKQGRAEERALLLHRLTARKFGAETAERLSGVLNGLADPERLAEVGEWIIECETSAELLGRAGSIDQTSDD